jgi:hypothetical protein
LRHIDIEVDKETGQVKILRYTAVQDIGRAIHPSYVEGERLVDRVELQRHLPEPDDMRPQLTFDRADRAALASRRTCAQMPPASRNVASSDSCEMPAPVSITIAGGSGQRVRMLFTASSRRNLSFRRSMYSGTW